MIRVKHTKKEPVLSTLLSFGMEITSEKRSRKFATLSQVKELNYQTLAKLIPKLSRSKHLWAMLWMCSTRPSSHWENNSNNSIKLTEAIKMEDQLVLHLPFTSIRCSWPRRRLYTWLWTSWNGKTKATTGPQWNLKMISKDLSTSTQLLKFLPMITIPFLGQHTLRLPSSWLHSRHL